MGKALLFWLVNPPDPQIPYDRWIPFREAMATNLVGVVFICCLLILAGYAWHSRRLRIVFPGDLFRSFAPKHWLWLSLLAGIAMSLLFIRTYQQSFQSGGAFATGSGMVVGMWATLLTVVIAFLVMCLPGVTPRMFRFRPLKLFLGNTGRTKRA